MVQVAVVALQVVAVMVAEEQQQHNDNSTMKIDQKMSTARQVEVAGCNKEEEQQRPSKKPGKALRFEEAAKKGAFFEEK